MVARSAAFAEGLFFAPYIIWGIDTARRPEKLPKTSAMVKSVYVKMQKSNEINHHAVLFMRNAEPEIVVFPKSTAAKLLKKAHQRQRQAGATYGFPPLCAPQDYCPPCLPMLAGRRPDTSTGDCKATPPKNTANELEPECLRRKPFCFAHAPLR